MLVSAVPDRAPMSRRRWAWLAKDSAGRVVAAGEVQAALPGTAVRLARAELAALRLAPCASLELVQSAPAVVGLPAGTGQSPAELARERRALGSLLLLVGLLLVLSAVSCWNGLAGAGRI